MIMSELDFWAYDGRLEVFQQWQALAKEVSVHEAERRILERRRRVAGMSSMEGKKYIDSLIADGRDLYGDEQKLRSIAGPGHSWPGTEKSDV